MLFNSVDFALFLPVVFLIYWYILNKNINYQNLGLVCASYFFYGWWDWRFLSLIAISTVVDYTIGLGLSKTNVKSERRALLWSSIVINIGILGFFKYYNFFLDNFINAFSFFGNSISANSLNIILPVGISFYTFQTLSYTIDVYRGKLKPTTNLISFAAFVSFFPQLVAGPIERATNLLPQFFTERSFDYLKAVSGLRQILWGLFKKVVVADTCANYANIIFENSSVYSGSTLALGAIFFAFQIYGDFSGYSDIAIGTSRLFGFNLMRNFAFPYFSRDIAEFWRRWHISLSTWFRDYLYIPLGGSRGSTYVIIRNTFLVFIISGFWHGANWTFIVWGGLNALYFLPLLLTKRNRNHIEICAKDRPLPSFKEFFFMLNTFGLTVLAWIFFRAESLSHAFEYITNLFKHPGSFLLLGIYLKYQTAILFITILIFIEWIGRRQEFALEKLGLNWKSSFRYLMYFSLVVAILAYGGSEQQFIYFQF